MCSVEARRAHRRSSHDVHAALTKDFEDHAEQVEGLAIRGQNLGQVIAGGRSVPPEQRCRGGATESATQTVIHCTETAAEVAHRPVHGLSERQVEARFISDVSAVEFVGVPGRPITAGMLEGTLPDKVEPGPSAPGVEAGPCAHGARRTGEPPPPRARRGQASGPTSLAISRRPHRPAADPGIKRGRRKGTPDRYAVAGPGRPPGEGGAGGEGLGRSRGGFTIKLHLSVDGRCRPLFLVEAVPGGRHPSRQALVRLPRHSHSGSPRHLAPCLSPSGSSEPRIGGTLVPTRSRVAVLVEDLGMVGRIHPYRDALAVNNDIERGLLGCRLRHDGELPTRAHPVIGSPRLHPQASMLSVSLLTLVFAMPAP